MNLAEGDRLSLVCNVKGIPTPSIRWYKDDVLIEEDDKKILISDYEGVKNAELVIESLEFDDRAHYQCVAENPVDNANSTILVRVKGFTLLHLYLEIRLLIL